MMAATPQGSPAKDRHPYVDARGITVWACCESAIGPPCAHRTPPHGSPARWSRWHRTEGGAWSPAESGLSRDDVTLRVGRIVTDPAALPGRWRVGRYEIHDLSHTDGAPRGVGWVVDQPPYAAPVYVYVKEESDSAAD